MWNKVWVPRKGCRVFLQQQTAFFVKNLPWQPGQNDIFMSYPHKLSPSSVIAWHFAWGKRLEEVQCIPENLQVHIALWFCCRSAFSSAGCDSSVKALWWFFKWRLKKKKNNSLFSKLYYFRIQNANNEVINRIIMLIPCKNHSLKKPSLERPLCFTECEHLLSTWNCFHHTEGNNASVKKCSI